MGFLKDKSSNRRSLIALVLAAVFAMGILLTASQILAQMDENAHIKRYDRKGMMMNIINSAIIPMTEDYIDQTIVLQEAVAEFRANPNQENLDALQQAWKDTSYAWEKASIIGYDRIMFVHNRISKTPTNTDFIDGFLSSDEEINDEFIAAIGSTSVGLPAIEYLIFDPEKGDEHILMLFTEDPLAGRRFQYLAASAINLQTSGEEIIPLWQEQIDHLDNPRRNVDQQELVTEDMLRMITNDLIDQVENIMQEEIGQPIGKTTGGDPRPDLVTAPRSEFSREQIIAELEGIRRILNGDTGIGYDDHLEFLEVEFKGEPLQDAINNQIDTLIATLSSIEQPLHIAVVEDPETLERAYVEARTLVRLIKVDMASELAIQRTFTDNDGD